LRKNLLVNWRQVSPFAKRKVLEMKLFGYGTEHKDFRNMLGDYLAVATDDCLFLTQKKRKRNSLALMEDLQKTR